MEICPPPKICKEDLRLDEGCLCDVRGEEIMNEREARQK